MVFLSLPLCIVLGLHLPPACLSVHVFVFVFLFVFISVFVLAFVSAYLSLALGCKLPPACVIEYLYMYLYLCLYSYLPTYLSLALGCKLRPACADFSQRELLSKTQLPTSKLPPTWSRFFCKYIRSCQKLLLCGKNAKLPKFLTFPRFGSSKACIEDAVQIKSTSSSSIL